MRYAILLIESLLEIRNNSHKEPPCAWGEARQENNDRHEKFQTLLDEAQKQARKDLEEQEGRWKAHVAELERRLAGVESEKGALASASTQELARITSLMWTERDKASQLEARLAAANEDARNAVCLPMHACKYV